MTDDRAENNLKDDAASDKPSKQTYVRPELKLYGNLRGMTQGVSGTGGDGLLMNMAVSDRSAKENIVCVGRHSLGIGLYLFDYKPEYRDECGHGRQLGVMADEVATVMPEAVSVHPRGHKMVNYAMLATRH
jgi:Chaperone of endosialidase